MRVENIKLFYHVIRCVIEIAKEMIVMKYIVGYGVGARTKYRRVFITCILVVSALFLCVKFIPAEIMPMAYVPIVIVSFALLTERLNFPRLLLSLISYLCICELDFFIGAIFDVLGLELIFGGMINSLMTNATGIFVVGTIGQICMHFDISFYKQALGRQKTFIMVEIIVLFINIGIITIMFGILSEQKGLKTQLLLLTAMLMSLMLSVIIMIFYCVVTSNREYKKVNEMNRMYLDAQKNHYERMKQIETDTRKFRHDIVNHINILQGLIMDRKYELAEEYLGEINVNMNKIQPIIRTGSDIVDAIVHEKYEKARENQIHFELTGVFPDKLLISNYDICTILANALDNAIEACQKVEGNRYIRIEIRSHQAMLHMIICNSMQGVVSLATTKRNKQYHGYGLNNLKECVERNQGQVEIRHADREFVLDIIVAAYA